MQLPDTLSPLAHQVLELNPSAYTKLVVRGPGNPRAKEMLSDVSAMSLFSPGVGQAHPRAAEALAGLWLWHDWLDESHTISQSLHDATGSYWHAIMHRREGDFSNSKYWYARVGRHPSLDVLANQVGAILHSQPADKGLLRITAGGWNSNALVDLVEAVCERPDDDPQRQIAVKLQQLEWRVLFDYCVR